MFDRRRSRLAMIRMVSATNPYTKASEVLKSGHQMTVDIHGAGEYTSSRIGGDIMQTTSAFKVGQRVQLAPHLARWMMSDRYGEVKKVTRQYVYVLMDKSGCTFKSSPSNLTVVD